MNEILGFLALCGLAAALGTWLLHRGKAVWPSRKVAWVGALPVPLIFAVLCLFVFVRAFVAPQEKCGVDACEMAMTFALIGLFWAAVGYGIGLGTAALVLRRLRA